MIRIQPALRHHKATIGLGVLAALAIAFIPGAASAASDRAVPAPPAHPTSADQIQNLDQVKTAIKAYYGDTVSAVPDPVNGATTLHFPSSTGAYAAEMARIEKSVGAYLRNPFPPGTYPTHHGTKAIVLDIDDTTLNTYDYEIYSNFVYNPTTNAAFVNAGAFPAVFGMPALVSQAQAEGYTIFFLTGRPITQFDGTKANLDSVGYPSLPDGQYYLKDATGATEPWLRSCAPTCTTIQYKSLTRAHIQSLGYDIVANLGDQYSDLEGGHADRDFKIPNPMYYLP